MNVLRIVTDVIEVSSAVILLERTNALSLVRRDTPGHQTAHVSVRGIDILLDWCWLSLFAVCIFRLTSNFNHKQRPSFTVCCLADIAINDDNAADIDECRTANECQYNQICINSPGGYSCTCPRGFRSTGPNSPCVGKCQQCCSWLLVSGVVISATKTFKQTASKKEFIDCVRCFEKLHSLIVMKHRLTHYII